MRRQGWVGNKQRLDQLFDRFDNLPQDDLELRAHWTKYLCVLTSGFLETSVRFILSEYALIKSSEKVASYVRNQLDRLQNVNMTRFEQTIGSFGQDWVDEVKAHADYDQLKAAVDSLINNRNQIAHGVSVTMSHADLKSYYGSVVLLLDAITAQCERETQVAGAPKKRRKKSNSS